MHTIQNMLPWLNCRKSQNFIQSGDVHALHRTRKVYVTPESLKVHDVCSTALSVADATSAAQPDIQDLKLQRDALHKFPSG